MKIKHARLIKWVVQSLIAKKNKIQSPNAKGKSAILSQHICLLISPPSASPTRTNRCVFILVEFEHGNSFVPKSTLCLRRRLQRGRLLPASLDLGRRLNAVLHAWRRPRVGRDIGTVTDAIAISISYQADRI